MSEAVPIRHSALQCFVVIARNTGLDLAVESILHQYAIKEDDVSPQTLKKIAQNSGFKAKVHELDWEALFKQGSVLPVVSWLKDGVAVIISGIQGNAVDGKVALYDFRSPQAVKLMGRDELEAIWSGTCLITKRIHAITDEEQPFGLRWFIPQILREGKVFRDVAIASMLINLLALATPFYFQIIIDKVLTHRSYSTLYTLTIGMAIALLFDSVFNYIKQYMLLHSTRKIDFNLAQKTFSHLSSLRIDFFEHSPSGVLLKHMQQTEKIRGFLTGKVFSSILDATVLLVLIPVLFLYNPILASVVLALSVLIGILLAVSAGPLKRRLTQVYQAEGDRQAHLVEMINGMRTVKSLALEPSLIGKWENLSATSTHMIYGVGKFSMAIQAVVGLLQKSLFLVIPWLGVEFVLNGSMTVGALVAFNMLSGRVSGPLVQIVSLISDFQEIRLSIDMLGNIMNRPPERRGAGRGLMPKIMGNISLDKVTFRYAPDTPPAVNQISLNMQAGAVLGIVGRSGSGKSTLTRLIQGLYSPQEGIIRIDNLDIREIELSHLRRNIGVVLQESFFFRGSVRENVSLTKPSATFEEIVSCCRLAGADEFIQRLPQGYDTMLMENASNLSGGQKQRLAIARALLTAPSILILDEATSALDAESEAIIQANLAAIAQNRTTLIISHRLSMLIDCHKILVMDQGMPIDLGSHNELVQRCALYRDLWFRQNRHLLPKSGAQENIPASPPAASAA